MPIAAVHIAQSLQRGLDSLIAFIPNLVGCLIILFIGYVIARLVKAAVTKLLEAVGLDRALSGSPAGTYVERASPGARPSRLVGLVAFWFIFIYAIAAAIGALKIPALTNFMANVQDYLPNVIAAVLILVVGVALAGAVGGLVDRLMGDTPSGRMAKTVSPTLILAIVVFMVLNQLKIAPAIVTTTYIALIGMLAVAGALAFGLGGRELAGEMMRDAYDSSRNGRARGRTLRPEGPRVER
ncbi:MAG TPA: mechanosensitive ion channel [Solirubrobacteraceae bacterium]|nr:mechanosensitive ion channel [Solirubrobacteraceae bacterium]